ncbi:MAG TPA: SDR family NAD(P)-dependent oxidoreductase [Candidatus Limnocylindria bacterium]|nr:SDR family NAD(P)-dependent oxidoreductase [Candidatus Limnocylindria bacterium]
MSTLSEAVVVVGAGPGMGLAVARRFAAEGFRPVLVARDPSRIDAPDLDVLGAVRLAADATDESSLRGALAQVREAVGDPAVLVFNPSAGISGLPTEVAPTEVARGLAIGAVAAITATQEVVPAMRAAGRGTLLFTGGGLALKPWAPMAALGMQKAALRSYVLALADEVGPWGVHAALVTIQGVVGASEAFAPEVLAEHYWTLHTQPREAWQPEFLAPGR